jgi:hypothetical protein
MHLGQLAAALGISEEYLRQLRRLEEAKGLGAVLKSAVGGQWRITEGQRQELHALFAAGVTVSEATRRQKRGKQRLSRATVSRERQRWAANRDREELAAPVAVAMSAVVAEQLALFPTSTPAPSKAIQGDNDRVDATGDTTTVVDRARSVAVATTWA